MSSWFYTQDGIEKGPIAAARLRQLAADSALKPDDLVRRSDWNDPVPARRISGLFGQVSSAVAAAPPPPQHSAPNNPHTPQALVPRSASTEQPPLSVSELDRWKVYLAEVAKTHPLLFGLASAGAVCALTAVGCLVLVLLLAITNRKTPDTRPIAPTEIASQPQADLVRDCTLEYWKSMHSIVASALVKTEPLKVSELFQRKANELRNLPMVNVDLEAVDLASDMALLFDKIATDVDPSRLGHLMFEGFVRGYMGDPGGPIVERRREVSSLQQEWTQLTDRKQRVRARLTAKYGIQF